MCETVCLIILIFVSGGLLGGGAARGGEAAFGGVATNVLSKTIIYSPWKIVLFRKMISPSNIKLSVNYELFMFFPYYIILLGNYACV